MKAIRDMNRAELVQEASQYGYRADRDDRDCDLRSVILAGRDGERWLAKAA